MPRCPECGEQVTDDEVIIVGVSIKHSNVMTFENWKKESIPFIIALAVLPVIGRLSGQSF